jgi:6-phosphogluconate dehydrogenase (decarboxylating)
MLLGMIGLGRMGKNMVRRLMRDGYACVVHDAYVEYSSEGRRTVWAAIEGAVPATVLTSALYTRFRSCEAENFAEKLHSAIRKSFGAHHEAKLS